MSFSTIATTAIMLIVIMSTLAVIIVFILMGINTVFTSLSTSSSKLSKLLNIRLSITSATYHNGTLCFNISNYGGKSLVIANGSILLLDYLSTSLGRRKITIIPYEEIIVNRLFLGNESLIINSRTAIELMPGSIVEFCVFNQDINTSSPLVMVFTSSYGVKASRIFNFG